MELLKGKANDLTLHFYIWFYVNGYIKLETLENFYVPKLEYFINKSTTRDIIAELELELTELSCGLQTEEDLKNNLKAMIK
jgi:hypothetical protein